MALVVQQVHIAQILNSIPVFTDLDRADLEEIVRIVTPVEFEVGDMVCDQDDPSDAMFIVVAGRALVSIRNKDGDFVAVAKLRPGELIGELALIDAQPRSARVVSITRLETLKLDRVDYLKLKSSFSPAIYKIMRRIARTVCARLRSTNVSIMNAINTELPELVQDLPSAGRKTFWRSLLEKIRGG